MINQIIEYMKTEFKPEEFLMVYFTETGKSKRVLSFHNYGAEGIGKELMDLASKDFNFSWIRICRVSNESEIKFDLENRKVEIDLLDFINEKLQSTANKERPKTLPSEGKKEPLFQKEN